MTDNLLYFNGIDGATGEYLLPPMTAHDVATLARGEKLEPQHLSELKWWYRRTTEAVLGPVEGVDPTDLSQAGWGIIFANAIDARLQQAIKEALKELLQLRRNQATQKNERYYKEYIGVDAYRPGESKLDFLARNGAGPGPADPNNVPYYLLLVGDPEAIPYRFQYQLDVQYAVGRIWFDTLEEYARYARTVVAAEQGQLSLSRRAAFFGVQNADDRATALSANDLAEPLAQKLAQKHPDWDVQTILKEEATKARLAQLLGGEETPAFLFTASHGMGFPNNDKRQLPHQGALLCQDWPGPVAWRQAIPTDFYFSADDLSETAQVAGLLAFHFACYGAGTPRLNDFAHQTLKAPTAIAPHAFIARLPTRLLAHPQGGALAVVGHVERAWGYSFMWERAGRQTQAFESMLERLLSGHPIGSATEFFNQRYGELAANLSDQLEELKFGRILDDLALAGLWTANNDARSYIILGDPAVRLVTHSATKQNAPRAIAMSDLPLVASPVAAQPTANPAPMQPTLTIDETPNQQSDTGDPFAHITGDLMEITAKLTQYLQAAIEPVPLLEVSLSTSDTLEGVEYANGRFTGGARLLARAAIDSHGNTHLCVAESEPGLDDALMPLYQEMVQQAHTRHIETMKTVGEIAARILTSIQAASSQHRADEKVRSTRRSNRMAFNLSNADFFVMQEGATLRMVTQQWGNVTHAYAILVDAEEAPVALFEISDMTRIQERFAGSPIVRAGAEVNPSLAAPLADFNRPASDLTLAELRPYLPPAIVLEAETALSALANEETQAWVTKCKLPGFVLRDSGQIAGVLPAAAVQQMLDRLPVAFDYGLPGEIITPTGKVVCEFCNTTNTVASLDPDNLPQCINRKLPTPGPHILKLGWL